MMYEEISESVVFAQNEWGSNSVCIALEDELIFIDTGLNTSDARAFRESMEAKYNRKASTLILTHGHIDHFFGMAAYSDLQVIAAEIGKERFNRIISAEYNTEFVENMSKYFLGFKESVKEAKPFMPTIWVDEKITIGRNKELIFEIKGGHSGCSSVIHYVPEKVVITGDLLQVDVYPYFGEPDTDLEKWISALKTWEGMDIKAVLPGHGRHVEKSYLTGVRVFFEEMLATVKQLKADGIQIEEVAYNSKIPTGYWSKEAVRKPAYDFSITNLYRKL